MTTPTERSARRAAIRAARERAAKATPGPWHFHNFGYEADSLHYINTIESGLGDGVLYHEACWHITPADAEFIPAARTDVPQLCDDADRYHDLVERVEALAKVWRDCEDRSLDLCIVELCDLIREKQP